MDNSKLEPLIKGAKQKGIIITDIQKNQFLKYMDFLLKENLNINLTAITDPAEICIKHFLDSICCIDKLYIPEGAAVIDVGTGAGFPGIPIKIMRSDIHLTLLDSLNKRVSFLKETCRLLELNNVQFIHHRAEDAAHDQSLREKFDVAVSRAVAPLPVLCEFCLPFVKLKGSFMAYKGANVQGEIDVSKNAVDMLGGILDNVILSDIMTEDGIILNHKIINIKKVKNCPTNLPRKAGKPAKKPL